ncbi:MAG: flagellar biosynthesis protein FlhF [Anaerolineales bacterium]
MEPRTFTAPTTQEALELVQNELGPEAIILSVRQVPSGPAWEVWKQPQVEVLAIPATANATPKASLNQPTPPPQQAEKSAVDIALKSLLGNKSTTTATKDLDPRAYLAQLAEKLARQQIEGTPPQPETQPPPKEKTAAAIPAALVRARQELNEQGLDPEIIKDLLRRVAETVNPKVYDDEERLRQILRKQLETYLRILRIERWQAGKTRTARILYVVGPSGAGKTSFCARLTAHLQQNDQRRVSWVCADTIRTGAIAQTRAYAEVLGIEPYFAYTSGDLKQIFSELGNEDLILVDTPARNPYNSQEIIELSEILTAAPQRVTFLVLPASAKESDLQQAVAAFSPLGINAFVFSKLDETRQYGSLFNVVWKSKIPIAYLCDGNQILDHFRAAQPNLLCELLLSKS